MSGTLFSVDDTARWVESRPELRTWGAVRSVEEIGDGNLNQVFRVQCESGSMIVKQSMAFVRIDPSWPLAPERIEHEALSYEQWNRLMPGAGPRLLSFDAANHALAVEDLRRHRVWRGELQNGEVQTGAAASLGRHVADAAELLSAGALEAQPGDLPDRARNPVMTQLMDDVIFTFPYVEHPHNSFPPEVEGLVDSIRADPSYMSAKEDLAAHWRSSRDALIHGDLHTGSVMVLGSDARMIDAEFSWVGPISWDVGEMVGNLLIAGIHGRVTHSPVAAELDRLAIEFWSAFAARRAEANPERAPVSATASIDAEVVGYAGLEMVRRVIGSGKADEIQALSPEPRALASEAILRAGAELVRSHRELDRERCLDVIDHVLA